MKIPELKKIVEEIKDFFDDYGIEGEVDAVEIEREWTDFKAIIKDPAQMERINTWLQTELKTTIKDWSDIDVSAPIPVLGKENVLRVRIYGNN